MSILRCCDDDLSVHELLVEFAVLALLVRGRHERVALVLKPFPDTELVLRCAEQTGFLIGMLFALHLAPSASGAPLLKMKRQLLRRRGRGGPCPVERMSLSAF